MRVLIKDDTGYADELSILIYNYAKSKNIPADVKVYPDGNEYGYDVKAQASLDDWLLAHRRASEQRERPAPCLIIKKRNLITQIPYRSILYFSKDKHYTDVHTQKGIYRYISGFKEVTDGIPEIYKHCFIQCYRSIIVNLTYVRQIEKDAVRLVNEEEIPVSETYSKTVKEAFKDYYLSTQTADV